MSTIKAGIIGMGFIGNSHLEAVRRIGFAEVLAITDVNYDLVKKKADEFNIPRCYKTIDELLSDPEINIVHNCTPNHLHFEINNKIIKAGKHIFSEKPLAISSQQSESMLELLNKNPDLVHAVNFIYRMNPLVQDMKNRIAAGEIGKPTLVHGSYLQDWLLFDSDYNWRIEPELGGPSRAIADIGSHWIDLAQTVLGARIIELNADLLTVIPTRKKPKNQVETFSLSASTDYEEKKARTEDYGAVMIKFDNGVRGIFYVSQVSAGRKCYLSIEIDGSKASYSWNQETADQMWMGVRDGNNSQIMRNPNLMTKDSRQYTQLAAGHPEGWNDAMRNNVYSIYKYILDGKKIGRDKTDFASFHDGHYIVRLTEAILKSNAEKHWIKID